MAQSLLYLSANGAEKFGSFYLFIFYPLLFINLTEEELS